MASRDTRGKDQATVAAVHARKRHIHIPHIRFHRHEVQDRPLAGAPHPDKPWHWKLYGCELIATAILMIIGVGSNVVLLAPGSPIAALFADHPLIQTSLCGLLFGGAGGVAAFTRFGRVSGAHVNPSVTLAFSLSSRLAPRDACGYFGAQIVGAVLGTGIIFLVGMAFPDWGHMASSVSYAATSPAQGVNPYWSLLGELVLTFGLILVIYLCAAKTHLHPLPPWAGAIYFALANPLLAWLSGDSSNFVRSLAPALYSGHLGYLWVYLFGPIVGAAIAVWLLRSHVLGKLHLHEARIINFGHHGRVPRFEAPEATAREARTHDGD